MRPGRASDAGFQKARLGAVTHLWLENAEPLAQALAALGHEHRAALGYERNLMPRNAVARARNENLSSVALLSNDQYITALPRLTLVEAV